MPYKNKQARDRASRWDNIKVNYLYGKSVVDSYSYWWRCINFVFELSYIYIVFACILFILT